MKLLYEIRIILVVRSIEQVIKRTQSRYEFSLEKLKLISEIQYLLNGYLN